MGSHSGEAGAWVSGPADVAPDEYHWGYSKMTNVSGLFAAGDGVGACPHRFSSDSFIEGRLAGKSAVSYALDHRDAPNVDDRQIEQQVWAPMVMFEENQYASTNPDVNPNYLSPRQGLFRLQKLMDGYVTGVSAGFTINEATMLRCHELIHRAWMGEAHLRHMLHRKETRWPGFYYRSDYPEMDEANWRVFVNSRYDAESGEWNVFTRPCPQVF